MLVFTTRLQDCQNSGPPPREGMVVMAASIVDNEGRGSFLHFTLAISELLKFTHLFVLHKLIRRSNANAVSLLEELNTNQYV